MDASGGAVGVLGLLPSPWWLALLAAAGVAGALAAARRGGAHRLFLLPVVCATAWATLLPWPALVAWAGPAAIIPFALAGVGLLLALSPLPRLAARGGPIAAGVLAAALLGLVLVATRHLPITGDEPHYLLATQSLLADGDLDLANNYDAGDYRAYYPGLLEPRHVALGVLAQQFSFHGPGVSVLVVPGFALAGAAGARATVALVAALGAGFLWAAARRLTGSTAAAWLAWAALVGAAPFTFHAVAVYPDAVGAAITCAALWALVALADEAPVRLSALVGVGAALAALPWLHLRLSATAGLFGLALVAVMARRRRDAILPFAAAPIISLVLWVASSWVMFRTLDPTWVFRQQAAGSLAATPAGLLGLFFDAEYGLFAYAPVMALAALGLPATLRRAPLTGLVSALLVAITAGVAGAWVWWGGTSAPARFLVPVLPLACLWLAAWWAEAAPASRAFAGALLTVGGCLTAMLALVERGAFIVNAPDGRGTIFDWISPNVDLALALPSLFRAGASPGSEAPIAAIWVIAGAAALALTHGARRWRAGRGDGRWLLASAVVLLYLTGAAAAAWWWRGAAPWTADRGQLRLLQAAAAAALDVGVRGAPPRLAGRDAVLSALRIAGPTDDPRVVLHLPFVPAGTYALEPPPASSPFTGHLALELGRGPLAFATWAANDAAGSPRFSLAAPIYRVRVVSDTPAAAAPVVRLRPLRVVPSAATMPVAQQAAAYGDLVVYSLDTSSYPEADGIWLAADRDSTLLIAGRDAGAVSYALTLETEDAAAEVRFDDPALRAVALAAHDHARLIVTRDGARPATPLTVSVSSTSATRAPDGRRLGVFVRVSRR